jgi:type III secretion protein J
MVAIDNRARFARIRPVFWALLIACVLVLSGCGNKVLHENLTEQHANEIVAVLYDAGISAEKEKSGETSWSVSVPGSEVSSATNILSANGLPKQEFESLGTVFKKTGMSSTPAEERARWNFGKSQELEKTITDMEGVISARVHLAVPEPDPLSREAKPSAASIYVKFRTGYDMRSKQGAIKTMLSNSIEGLSYDRVSVYMEPAQSLPLSKRKTDMMPWDSVLRIILALVAIILLGLAGRAYWRGRSNKSTVEPALTPNSTAGKTQKISQVEP